MKRSEQPHPQTNINASTMAQSKLKIPPKVAQLKYFIKNGTNRKFSLYWRIGNCIIFLCVFVNTFIRDVHYGFDTRYTMSYLTTISMLVLVFYLAVGVLHASKDRPVTFDMVTKVYRVMFILAVVSQLCGTLFYWPGAIYETLAEYDE